MNRAGDNGEGHALGRLLVGQDDAGAEVTVRLRGQVLARVRAAT